MAPIYKYNLKIYWNMGLSMWIIFKNCFYDLVLHKQIWLLKIAINYSWTLHAVRLKLVLGTNKHNDNNHNDKDMVQKYRVCTLSHHHLPAVNKDINCIRISTPKVILFKQRCQYRSMSFYTTSWRLIYKYEWEFCVIHDAKLN